MGWWSSQHRENVEFKQRQRQQRIQELSEYQQPISKPERDLLSQNVESIVSKVSAGLVLSLTVLKAYGKAALISQEKTNCLTEIMIKDAETWALKANLQGPLAGFPVSLKDPMRVAGYDHTSGYSALVGKTAQEHSPLVRLLLDAGAVPYVKTNVPITMMTIEGQNDLFGRCLNPWKSSHAPGGSSQGEGALIGSGGSRIGVGTDIGGSVRVPAAWSGIYSLRFSSYRFPSDRGESGFEGIPSVASPMAASLKDLKYFSDAVMGMDPWKYDCQLVNQPWNADFGFSKEKLKIGVLNLKQYLPPTPAVERALSLTVDALKRQGHDLVEFELPDAASEYDWTAFKLFHADAYAGAAKLFLPGEQGDAHILNHRKYTRWPTVLRRVFEFFLNLFGYKELAWRLRSMSPLSMEDYYKTISHRELLRRRMFEKWNAEQLDFLISPPHPSPALANGVDSESFYTILYTSLWNLIDYPAGIVPVSRVDQTLDALPPAFSVKDKNYATKFIFDSYDAEEMEGLPLAVQIIARRYHDEEALAAMRVVENALHEAGHSYK